jgi:hypothetical protein
MKYAISGGVTTTVDEEEKDAVHLSMGSTSPSMGSKDAVHLSMGSTSLSMGSKDAVHLSMGSKDA